jgi:hypothetical protein
MLAFPTKENKMRSCAGEPVSVRAHFCVYGPFFPPYPQEHSASKGTCAQMIEEFAANYHLRLKRDRNDRVDIIPGRLGQIFDYSDNELGVLYMPNDGVSVAEQTWHTGQWERFKAECLAAGMKRRQNAHDEGSFSFDPRNPEQSKLAIRVAGAFRKRQLSPEHKAKLLGSSRSLRFKASDPVLNSVSSS